MHDISANVEIMLHLHMTKTFAHALASSPDHLLIVPIRDTCTQLSAERGAKEHPPTHALSDDRSGDPVFHVLFFELLIFIYSAT